MNNLKWFILVALIAYILIYIFYEKNEYEDHDFKKLQEQIDSVNVANDSLQYNFEKLNVEYKALIAQRDSFKSENLKKYEKIVAIYDSLSIDEHIIILSGELSKKDSIRW